MSCFGSRETECPECSSVRKKVVNEAMALWRRDLGRGVEDGDRHMYIDFAADAYRVERDAKAAA